jgi:lipopolysaccharide transport system permease protein
MEPIVYTPEGGRDKTLWYNLKEIYTDVKNFRHLLKSMVLMNLTQQYKKSILGISWLIISPLISVIVWVLLHASGVFNPGESQVPYVAFVLLSNSIWVFFVSFFKGISDSIMGRGGELLQNNFPRIIIVFEKIIVSFVNFAIPLSLSILVLLIYGVQFSWSSLLFLPALLPLIFLGIGLGLVFAVIKVVAVDFIVLFDNAIEVLKFLTPVVYTTAVASDLIQQIIRWNPLTYLIDYPRVLLLGMPVQDTYLYLYCSLGTMLLLLLSIRYFYLALPWVFEKITL